MALLDDATSGARKGAFWSFESKETVFRTDRMAAIQLTFAGRRFMVLQA